MRRVGALEAQRTCKCRAHSHCGRVGLRRVSPRQAWLSIAAAAATPTPPPPPQQQQSEASPPLSTPLQQPDYTAKPRRPNRLRPRTDSGSGGGGGGDSDGRPLLTFDEVQAAAAARGLQLTLKTLGPFYRIVCREAAPASSNSTINSSTRDGDGGGPKVLGVTTGFLASAFKLAHCDTLQVFTRGLRGNEGARVRGGAGLNIAILLGGAVFAHAAAAGCVKAEILAINDDDAWHERLVRYYSFFGFEPVRKVGGNGLSDVPHLLVWGGEGTRMDADVGAMLRKWGPVLRRQARGGGGDQLKSTG